LRFAHQADQIRLSDAKARQVWSARAPRAAWADNLRQFIDVRRKAIRMFQFAPETHPSLPLMRISTAI
jgi:hypothetical protein